MKKSTAILIITLIVFIGGIGWAQATNEARDNKTLIEIINKQRELIEKYKQFEDISVKIYINQVDSTGDCFDGSDDGVLFWNTLSEIDSLKNLK